MNSLLLLLSAAGASAALTLWQQRSIDNVRAANAGLSAQLLEARSSLESQQAALSSARAQLKQLEGDLDKLTLEHGALFAPRTSPLPTPEQEGWWPTNRPYFYLAKKYLADVRFDGRRIVTAAQARGDGDNPLARGEYIWASYRPFDEEGLNPHMAMLLGMSDEEVAAVNDRYAALLRDFQAVEAAHIQRVEPPEPDGDDGRVILARIPVLTSETQQLLDRWDQELDEILGSARSEILRQHAGRFIDEDLDQLGAEPREFLRQGSNLLVRYHSSWGTHFGGPAYLIGNQPEDWRYAHLFGPGAPCELK